MTRVDETPTVPTANRRSIALMLFDGAAVAHNLPQAERELLDIAVQYHDCARSRGYERPARSGRDLVLGQPIVGLDSEAQCIIASAVAFQGDRMRRDQELAFLRLSEDDQKVALRLSAVMSLADGLAANGAQISVRRAGHNGSSEVTIIVTGDRAAHAVEAASERDWRWFEAIGPLTIRPAAEDERIAVAGREELPALIAIGEPAAIPAGELSFAENARRSLRRQFEKMLAREADVRSGEDPEDVHQMRVATRRLRASLQVVAPVFEPSLIKRLRRKLRTTADALGGVRDADVFLMNLREYRESLTAARKASLDQLIERISTERAAARVALLAELESRHYRQFKHEFARFLTTPDDGVAILAEHGGPLRVRDLAGSLIWRRYEDLRSFEVILPNAPDVQLHEMRIAGKRLRYTLEFFTDVLGDTVKHCLDPLAALQETLGSLQDSVVAREHIERLAMANMPGPRAYLTRRDAERSRLLRQLPTRWARINNPTYRRRLFALVNAV